ncbi:hypothetical protein EKI60_03090 [Candidatus Saccharibacteria bacterium]|nr:MAG: hypothetical protein EKI60_03090 [Candidatus Saccharibacteria bacterium]
MHKRLKQSLLVGGAVATVGLAGLGSVGLASAATASKDPQAGLIDTLVSKFNLNRDEVQKVFDAEHQARQAEREAEQAERLKTLVTDGKLTQTQADKITAKAKELQTEREANRDTMKDKTNEERKAAMEAARDEIEQWLSDNDIPEEYGRLVFGGGHGRGPGGPGGPPPKKSSEE